MKKYPIYLLLCLVLTGCGTIDQMNALVNESTEAIYENIDAVDRSTCAIRRNQQLVDQSTQAIRQNKHALEEATK